MVSGDAPMVAKTVWTGRDFDAMSWHDVAIHAIALEPSLPYPGRLLVDLDYIVGGARPVPPATAFTFWMCPATLVFEHASDFTGDVNLAGRSFELALDAITRSEPDAHGDRAWTLAGHEFTMHVRASGFTQYLRRAPVLADSQRLTVGERGGISFDEIGFAAGTTPSDREP